MNKLFSTYLNLARFLAAVVVFLGHASGKLWTGGFLWQFGYYDQTAVIVFFVLSGYVIAYVADRKERTLQEFSASRIARLYSVVIPALVITFVIDYLGVRVAPHLYIDRGWYHGDMLLLRYLASFLLIHEAWGLELSPGVNIPFWSLSFEAFYYVFFAIWMFAGRQRSLLLVCMAVVAGPTIVAMFPIWLLGVVAYRRREARLVAWQAYALLAVSVLILALYPVIKASSFGSPIIFGRPGLIADYIAGVAFAINLLMAYRISVTLVTEIPRFGVVVAMVAESTFVLYLTHRPILQFLSYIGPDDPSSVARRLLVIGGTLLAAFLLTPPTEKLRKSIKQLVIRKSRCV